MSVHLSALGVETTGAVRSALLLTLGISVVLLFIACTNILDAPDFYYPCNWRLRPGFPWIESRCDEANVRIEAEPLPAIVGGAE